jgi:serine/threonine protein kinase
MPGSSHHLDPRRGVPDHELIRCIGRGAYGEIWLARSTLGTYRAVKFVYVNRFEHAEPYEREFRGVRVYEPLSREHSGLVDILHVGRDDRRGYFYYVMELADDARRGQDIDPTVYEARTLSGELKRRRRLSPRKTLTIGLDLCEALETIHRGGLVHRDIKPSNIIFVNGRPKLADIGLVAVASAEPATYVGTEGYVPPEGPGTPVADLYALGMVLYVTGTGLRPTEFPTLPTTVLDQPNPILLHLNQIILKACDRDPKNRFETAEEMRLALAGALASAGPEDEPEVPEVATPLIEAPENASPGTTTLPAESMPTGEITMVARQPLPTGHFKGTEWEQIAAVHDTSIVPPPLGEAEQRIHRHPQVVPRARRKPGLPEPGIHLGARHHADVRLEPRGELAQAPAQGLQIPVAQLVAPLRGQQFLHDGLDRLQLHFHRMPLPVIFGRDDRRHIAKDLAEVGTFRGSHLDADLEGRQQIHGTEVGRAVRALELEHIHVLGPEQVHDGVRLLQRGLKRGEQHTLPGAILVIDQRVGVVVLAWGAVDLNGDGALRFGIHVGERDFLGVLPLDGCLNRGILHARECVSNLSVNQALLQNP